MVLFNILDDFKDSNMLSIAEEIGGRSMKLCNPEGGAYSCIGFGDRGPHDDGKKISRENRPKHDGTSL